ncbi:MAG: hypothetical protein JXA79_11835 [Deltaproteobacteria bacterium]|nr:hypothetical protein [Deltaproteobacteria bacterium]
MKDKSLGSQVEPVISNESPAAPQSPEDELYQEAIDRFADLFYRHALMILEEKRKKRDNKL